jgi:hypothetical protein
LGGRGRGRGARGEGGGEAGRDPLVPARAVRTLKQPSIMRKRKRQSWSWQQGTCWCASTAGEYARLFRFTISSCQRWGRVGGGGIPKGQGRRWWWPATSIQTGHGQAHVASQPTERAAPRSRIPNDASAASVGATRGVEDTATTNSVHGVGCWGEGHQLLSAAGHSSPARRHTWSTAESPPVSHARVPGVQAPTPCCFNAGSRPPAP